MHIPHFSTLIASFLLATMAAAFEVEDQKTFAVEGTTEVLRIISTTDTALFTPLVLAFQKSHPTIEIRYTTASSAELMKAIYVEHVAFDIALSSAMDLQTKLANDGFTQSYTSPATALLPEWGNWRDSVFAFTQEPAAIVINKRAFEGLPIPKTRQDLITVLRNNPGRFKGRVGTYDVRVSGLGYMFATQDARTSETFWRLTEVMGILNAQLYCCSSNMIEDVSSGKIAVAYNVLGSYASARKDLAGTFQIITPEDFTTMMLRTIVIPKTAQNTSAAHLFTDHLIRSAWLDDDTDDYPFPKILPDSTTFRPIKLGPGLLVFLDDLKRRRFLGEWMDAIVQP